MAESDGSATALLDRGGRVALWLGFLLVVLGMVNNIPSIPGLDAFVATLAGNPSFAIRKFPYEWLYPTAFIIMMVTVVCQHSFFRGAPRQGLWRSLRLFMDIGFVVMTVVITLTYLIEIDSVCLIDQFTGERAQLLAESLQAEREFAESYGLPIPDSVDDPQCLNTSNIWLFPIVGIAITMFLGYNIKVWGLPLVLVAIGVAAYTIITVAVWYFHGAEDINKYLMTKLGGEPRRLLDGRPKVHDILVNNARGLFGQFMNVLLNTVFPYIVLGSLFGVSAGGKSLIKLAFRWTRLLRGGPGHAAIVSSALFGTISGGPVVNVLSTGALTIPMMLKRGFSRTFAGGVEAAASSGGQIMPPVMGVAAFVLASLTLVSYREVIIAAAIPALLYFACLFLIVVFQSRRQGIEVIGELTSDMMLTRQDRINLVMIIAPILLILTLLLTPKETVGCGWIAGFFGVETTLTAAGCSVTELPWAFQLFQNSAGDAGSAGWWAAVLVMVLLFLDPVVRAAPRKLFQALAAAGVLISTLYLMFLAVSVIDFCLNFTGLSDYIARDMLTWLKSIEINASDAPLLLLLALAVTMSLAILLGMGMPTVPAYINVALLMGPMLAGLGISLFTAHMFIFYFAVASAITPPVAIAAFAAASITKADPMATGFAAVRCGIVMFVIPFVFAFYPEILLIDAALVDPLNSGKALPGYESGVDYTQLVWLIARLVLGLYLLASALVRFDQTGLSPLECCCRLVLAVLVIFANPTVYASAILAAALMIFWHQRRVQHNRAASTVKRTTLGETH